MKYWKQLLFGLVIGANLFLAYQLDNTNKRIKELEAQIKLVDWSATHNTDDIESLEKQVNQLYMLRR